jgi:hypothetical protein
MTASILRAVGIAMMAAGLLESVAFVDYETLCDAHHVWQRRQVDPAALVRDTGFGVARQGDAIFVCTKPHCFAWTCHEDADCVCAPASSDASAIEGFAAGSCALDQPAPSFADTTGACRYARCNVHVGP